MRFIAGREKKTKQKKHPFQRKLTSQLANVCIRCE